MNPLTESKEVPQWLGRASRAVARFMERSSIRSFSSLHKETGLNYRTLRKLSPGNIDPTVTFEAVANIFAQLFYYIKESDGTDLDEDDDFEGLDAEWAKVMMEYFGRKKAA